MTSEEETRYSDDRPLTAEEYRRFGEKLCAEALRRVPEPFHIFFSSTQEMRHLAEEVVREVLSLREEAGDFIPLVYRFLLEKADKFLLEKAHKAAYPSGFWIEPIPLLTKVFQFRPGVDEVTWPFFSMFDFPAAYQSGMLMDPKREERVRNSAAEAPAEVEAICTLTQSAMRTIYEHQGVTPEVLEGMNHLKQGENTRIVYIEGSYHHRTGIMPLNLQGEEEASQAEEEDFFDDLATLKQKRAAILEKGLLPLSGIVEETQEPSSILAVRYIARELERVVLYDSRILRKCEECASIFERHPDRPNQRFCSNRCSARNGQRRRRAEKTHLEQDREEVESARSTE